MLRRIDDRARVYHANDGVDLHARGTLAATGNIDQEARRHTTDEQDGEMPGISKSTLVKLFGFPATQSSPTENSAGASICPKKRHEVAEIAHEVELPSLTAFGEAVERVHKLFADFLGLWRVCGAALALRWIGSVVAHTSSVIRTGNLQSADRALGSGPFTVVPRQYGSSFQVAGEGVMSGIREMYVRDVYMASGWHRIQDGEVVLDLGANIGNFTNMALSMGPNVRVVAVEPNLTFTTALQASVGLNTGYVQRTLLIRAFLGTPSDKVDTSLADYENAPWLTETDLMVTARLTRVDFIKCDIEGGEFSFFPHASRLLAMARAIAIEIHAFAGNPDEFVKRIESHGFQIGPRRYGPDGTVTLLAKKE